MAVSTTTSLYFDSLPGRQRQLAAVSYSMAAPSAGSTRPTSLAGVSAAHGGVVVTSIFDAPLCFRCAAPRAYCWPRPLTRRLSACAGVVQARHHGGSPGARARGRDWLLRSAHRPREVAVRVAAAVEEV
eukprot:scaffold23537_cov27-Phaeocystis_antarctica.AAC.1